MFSIRLHHVYFFTLHAVYDRFSIFSSIKPAGRRAGCCYLWPPAPHNQQVRGQVLTSAYPKKDGFRVFTGYAQAVYLKKIHPKEDF